MAKTETVHVDVRPHIAAVARPGDTILIGLAYELGEEDIEALDESFQPLVDQGIKVGFIDQVTSMVVVKGDREPVEHAPGRAVCCELCSRTGQTVCRDEV